VIYAFIRAERAFPVAVQCAVFNVSRSGFYAYCNEPQTAREARDAALLPKVRAAFAAGKANYGSPRVTEELQHSGVQVSKGVVERIMRDNDITPKKARKFIATTDSAHEGPIAPNVLEREFTTEKPNHVWVTDVTYVWTYEGWLYLAVILDLYSRRVVGWAAGANNDTRLALTALNRAVALRNPAKGWIHHSDRGSVYASGDYRKALTAAGAVQSMSRKGDCWDNAVAESFFGSIKRESLDACNFKTRTEAMRAIDDYIESFYNVKRRHSTIGYVSPIEFELESFASSGNTFPRAA
jgi:putative transposase